MPRTGGIQTTVDDERVRGRRAVLAALAGAAQPMTVAEVAAQLQVHANTVRAHLAALISSGQVARTPVFSNRPGRPTLRYVAVPGMDPGGIRHYRILAGVMADQLATEPDAQSRMVEVGRRWGRRLARDLPDRPRGRNAAIRRAIQVLDQLGFDPEQVDAKVIGLRHCPFLELAQVNPDVICALHLGMVQGLLAAQGGQVEATGIIPFAQPNLCVITIDGPSDRAGSGRERPVRPEPEASA